MEQQILNNRYLIEKPLGVGGMAKVYQAQDLTLERTVAVKILLEEYSEAPEFHNRFRHEAKSAAKLSHPNIVTVYDFGLTNQTIFIVMEYVPGTDIKSMIKEAGKMEVEETIHLLRQACDGLGYAHRAGVVHCDIKPQNLLVTPDNRLKIVDFGIARAMASIPSDETNEVVWGSPNYFSPEQASGKLPLPASDVYSLGVVMFNMLTGRLPFYGETADDLARKHRESLPPTPRRFNPSIPQTLEKVILTALDKKPEDRSQNADEFGKALDEVLPQFNRHNFIGSETTTLITAEQQNRSAEVPLGMPSNTMKQSPTASNYPKTNNKKAHQSDNINIDWITWLLALFALIMLGGLIPFWLWVYYQLNPPF